MPTYEYACENCRNEWEVDQRMSDDPIRKCPKCGKLKAKRRITGGNFILKGGGWYSDLYSSSSKSTKSSSSESTTSAASESTKSETKSEAKPEAKAETKPAPKKASKD